ncbi:MAG: hypothetical protein P9M03_10110 [Candidatus Theseobacter exili]|nr:hypothetical protein [Candidatus Theseobacter exili]
MNDAGKRILCPSCERESVLHVKKIYDGFTPVGIERVCGFCSHVFGDEDSIPEVRKAPNPMERKGERKVCELCSHYVVNPWTQKCTLHKKEVTSLDCCDDFEKLQEFSF